MRMMSNCYFAWLVIRSNLIFILFIYFFFLSILSKIKSLRSYEKTYARSYTLIVRKNRYGQRQRFQL